MFRHWKENKSKDLHGAQLQKFLESYGMCFKADKDDLSSENI